jgi:hypothetical protein
MSLGFHNHTAGGGSFVIGVRVDEQQGSHR